MAPQVANAPSGLKQRVYSSLVLAPVALGALYLGTPYFEALLVCLAVAMAWEWARMCASGRFDNSGWAAAGTVVVAIGAATLGRHDVGLVAVAAGAALVFALSKSREGSVRYLAALGPIVIGLSCVALSWLRQGPETGLPSTVWIIVAVWTTDISAYFIGRRIGGPRLAPRISPKKTWSGLAGAIICTACWGGVWGLGHGAVTILTFAVLGAVTALVAQTGDLSISALKRRFDVKDTSDLIPGHGGVLDRFDGLILTAPAFAFYLRITEGMVWPPL